MLLLFFMYLQVATFILQKILLDETGLSYICQTYERFSHVAMILVIKYYFLSLHKHLYHKLVLGAHWPGG